MEAASTAPLDAARPEVGASAPRVRNVLNATVVVAALGYFVDVYDLLLFSIVRVESLVAIGVAPEALLDTGVLLLNLQMAGLLVGGFVWGVLGDRRGRVSILLGSIALYSLANVANAFVTNVPTYAALRFIAGVGLAGELGAAVTLVSEIMTKETRGYGTAIVAGAGLFGAVVAALVAGAFTWRVSFLVGGGLGLVLLAMRVRLADSGMFAAARAAPVTRGSLRLLFATRERAVRYAYCILLGLPIWFIVGVPITFAPEFGVALGFTGPVTAGTAVLWTYVGGAVGDVVSGALSQRVGSRSWVMLAWITLSAGLLGALLFSSGLSPTTFYGLCVALGFAFGYWAIFVTNAAEQFGTNLRATVATTAPNLIRGSVIPITLAVTALRAPLGLVRATMVVGAVCLLVALWALRSLPETHGRDLDFVEA